MIRPRAIASEAGHTESVIALDELTDASARLGVSLADVQRDYVFGWLIAGVFRESPLGDSLVLKGGNAFRKGYFPATRYSDDLDFSTPGEINPDSLLDSFNTVCRFAEARTGVTFDVDRNFLADVVELDARRTAIKLRLYFYDFSGALGSVVLKARVDVTEFDRLMLRPATRQLIHQYSDSSDCSTEIACVALEEAIADKMKCLLQRRHSHDLFDLVFSVLVNQEVEVDRRAVATTFLRKTIFEPSPATARALLLGVPFEAMRRFWRGIVCPTSSMLDFDESVDRVKGLVETLFGNVGAGRPSRAYFPPELRNPIVEAGVERRLIGLTYDNVTREVEPYSLSFMRRKDGVAREYFWAYDRTGGRRSGPGMKMFVNERVQRLEVLEQQFEPQYEISLAKAGDRAPSGELARQFKSGPRGTRVSTSRRLDRRVAVYAVVCPYCGKRFPRLRPSTKLNKHSDGYGNRCPGRVGHMA